MEAFWYNWTHLMRIVTWQPGNLIYMVSIFSNEEISGVGKEDWAWIMYHFISIQHHSSSIKQKNKETWRYRKRSTGIKNQGVSKWNWEEQDDDQEEGSASCARSVFWQPNEHTSLDHLTEHRAWLTGEANRLALKPSQSSLLTSQSMEPWLW